MKQKQLPFRTICATALHKLGKGAAQVRQLWLQKKGKTIICVFHFFCLPLQAFRKIRKITSSFKIA